MCLGEGKKLTTVACSDVGNSSEKWFEERFYHVAWSTYNDEWYIAHLSSTFPNGCGMEREEGSDSVCICSATDTGNAVRCGRFADHGFRIANPQAMA